MKTMAISQTYAQPRAGTVRWITFGIFVFIYLAYFIIDGHSLDPTVGRSADGMDRARVAAGDVGDSTLRQLAFLALGGLGLMLLIKPCSDRTRGGHALGALAICFIIWAILSLTWAENFGMTLRRLATFLLPAILALGLARQWSMQRVVAFAFVVTAIPMAIGVVSEILHGTFLLRTEEGGRFRGVAHPNYTGELLSMLILSALCMARLHSDQRRTFFVLVFIAFAILVMTGSRGGLAGLAAGWLVWRYYTKPLATVFLVFFAVALGGPLVMMVYGEQVIEMLRTAVYLGRTDNVETFTGRTPVWTYLIERYISERPLLGAGYGGFWTGQRINDVSANVPWSIIIYSHNGFIELALDLGLIGVALFCLILSATFVRSAQLFRTSGQHEWLFAAAIVAWTVAVAIPDIVAPYARLQNFVVMLVIAKLIVGGASLERR